MIELINKYKLQKVCSHISLIKSIKKWDIEEFKRSVISSLKNYIINLWKLQIYQTSNCNWFESISIDSNLILDLSKVESISRYVKSTR